MRLIETTQFWNEAHYFNERVASALSYADLFVIAEAEDSFSQKLSRPLLTPALHAALSPALRERTLIVPVDLKPLSAATHWEREAFLRQAGVAALEARGELRGDDIVIVQDFDEFFDARCKPALMGHFRWPWREHVHLRYRCTYYHLDWQVVRPRDHLNWTLPIAFRADRVRDRSGTWTNRLRNSRGKASRDYWGWHHSYLGNAGFITEKLAAFSHADDKLIEGSAERVQRGEVKDVDLFGRDFEFRRITDYERIGIPELAARRDLFRPAG